MLKTNQSSIETGVATDATIEQIKPKPEPPKVNTLYLLGYVFTLLIGSYHYGMANE